jgi:hypothetical protein
LATSNYRPRRAAVLRRGEPSILETLLGLSAVEIERLVSYQAGLWRQSGRLELIDTLTGLHPSDVRGDEYLGTGGWQSALLADVPADRLPPGLAGRPTSLVLEALPVPSGGSPPHRAAGQRQLRTSDLNDLYRRVINQRCGSRSSRS